MNDRFYDAIPGHCKCQHIVDKTCKQCDACECCELYTETIDYTSFYVKPSNKGVD